MKSVHQLGCSPLASQQCSDCLNLFQPATPSQAFLATPNPTTSYNNAPSSAEHLLLEEGLPGRQASLIVRGGVATAAGV